MPGKGAGTLPCVLYRGTDQANNIYKKGWMKIMQKLMSMKEKWNQELSAVYGGELEVDYLPNDDQDELAAGYYACAFHNEPKGDYDSWLNIINHKRDRFFGK